MRNNMTDKNIVVPALALKAIPLMLLTGAAVLSPPASAENECGVGPTVTCAGSYAATGVEYNFDQNLSMTWSTPNLGNRGMTLNGSNGADLTVVTTTGNGRALLGFNIFMDTGDVTANILSEIVGGIGVNAAAGGLHIHTGGKATVVLDANPSPTAVANVRLSAFTVDVGEDSTVDISARREIDVMTLSPRAGANLLVRNAGFIGRGLDPVEHTVAIRGAGAGDLIVDNTAPRGRIRGNFDFSAATGGFTLLNDNSGRARQGGVHLYGENTFGGGEVEIINGTRGVIRSVGYTTLDMSDSSSSRLVNEGRLMMGTQLAGGLPPAVMTFKGVDSFENSGLILLGAEYNYDSELGLESNRRVNDRMVMQDVNFIGSGNSRIAMDVNLAAVAQLDCSALVAGDCVQFTGNSSTDGVTRLTITDARPAQSSAGFNQGIVLIDGSSAAEHFVLDPSSQFYVQNSSAGAGLQKGLVAYRFVYDATAQQHKLVGTLADEGVQASSFGTAAQEIWRTTADTWFDRQAQSRADGENGLNPTAVWTSVNIANGNRDLSRTVAVNGSNVDYNLSQDQQTTHVAFGVDLLRASNWNAGITAGYVYSGIDYDATKLQSTTAGFAGGVYASVAAGPITVDGLINTNFMRQSMNTSHLGLGQHSRLRMHVKSNGARVDAGWKLPVSEGFWLQPLAGVSYVNTSIGDMEVDGGSRVRFGNDDRSFRAGLGLRAGVESGLMGLKAHYSLTGRYWNELEGENTSAAIIPNGNEYVRLVDDVGGNFSEIAGGLNLANDSGSLSGHVQVKSQFGDDYSSLGASAGVRWQW